MKKMLIMVLLVMVSFLLVSCGDSEVEEKQIEADEIPTMKIVSGDTATVTISNGQFMPTDLEIKIGTTVTWNNADSEEHTVTFENGDFDEMLPVGASVSFVFEEAGMYGYFCQFEPGMRGLVVVG